MSLYRRIEPGGQSVTSLSESHGPEDGPGEDALAADEEHHTQDEDEDPQHQSHQAAVASAALLTTSFLLVCCVFLVSGYESDLGILVPPGPEDGPGEDALATDEEH